MYFDEIRTNDDCGSVPWPIGTLDMHGVDRRLTVAADHAIQQRKLRKKSVVGRNEQTTEMKSCEQSCLLIP